uniref:Uncharacterized LOC112653003 n=1 Tax=Canis lupus dingo TaxID=286419 RepID=A0A8C0LHK8_CANLU
MSHFTNWKVSQVSKSLLPYDNVRVPRERKKENKKQEDLPEDQPLPGGQMLQKEGAHISKYKAKDTEDGKATKEGPSLGRTEPRKDAKDWKLLIPLGPVYPPLISSLSTSKAVRQHWDLSPPIAKSLRIHDQGPFQHFLDMKAEKRLAGQKERRSRFGDIAVHKRYQFGQFFSPFQALSTTVSKLLLLGKGFLSLLVRTLTNRNSFPFQEMY